MPLLDISDPTDREKLLVILRAVEVLLREAATLDLTPPPPPSPPQPPPPRGGPGSRRAACRRLRVIEGDG